MPTQAPEKTNQVFLPIVQGALAPAPAQKLVIDPITRIEGHLRIEVKIDNGYVRDAWSAGMMFRGIELLMPGRDPRDAWVYTQRICGV
jgi:Ni,Fe-hydrogenase I large subunit